MIGPTHELILGGQRSGKSRCAEARAAAWLGAAAASLPGPEAPPREATLIATALPGDVEMRDRITRHRADRARRVPGLATVEEPRELAAALRRLSAPHRLVVVDCLTLWLTNLLMPLKGEPLGEAAAVEAGTSLVEALRDTTGPVLLVSNEIGLGVTPASPEARRFVDELGRLHQALAAACPRVTLMVAGIEWPIKRERVDAA